MHKKFRWSKVYESSEEELIEYLEQRRINFTRISREAGSEDIEDQTTAEQTIWCAEGSLRISDGSTRLSLQPGDAVTLSANRTYIFTSGMTGYTLYETAVSH